MRAIGASYRPLRGAVNSGAVLVFELAFGELLQRHREVVPLGVGLDHRRRVLPEAALAEIVEVAVDLSSTLGRHDNCGVMRIGVLQKLVYAWFDHSASESSSRRTTSTRSAAARPTSSLTTQWSK